MICPTCGKETAGVLGECDACKKNAVSCKTTLPCTANAKLLNFGLLALAFVLTATALVSFFIATFTPSLGAANYSVASLYILVMLLVAPTLKIYLDKVSCKVFKRLNLIAILSIFTAILVMAVTTFFSLLKG